MEKLELKKQRYCKYFKMITWNFINLKIIMEFTFFLITNKFMWINILQFNNFLNGWILLNNKLTKNKYYMLKNLYSNKTKKELNFFLSLYTGLLILCILLPVIFSLIGYLINDKIYFSSIFLLLAVFCTFNIYTLRKILKEK